MDKKNKEVKENKKEQIKKEGKGEKVKETKKEEQKAEKVKEIIKEEKIKTEKKPETPKIENKKDEVKKEKSEKKKNTWIGKLIVVIAVLVVAALLTFMIVTSSDPKKSVDGFLTNLKAGDFEKAQEFIEGEEFLKDAEYNAETQKLLFDKISWKVTKITKENDKAIVELEITNKDFNVVTTNCMKRVLQDIKSVLEGNSAEQDIEKYFIEELKNEEVQTTTHTKSLQLVKVDKKSKVLSTDELTNTLLPGLEATFKSLEN